MQSMLLKEQRFELIESLRGQMIVSCQAEGDDPFNVPEYVALFARAAMMGGAKGIRTEGTEKIKAVRRVVDLPVIGLLKSRFGDGSVRITGTVEEVAELVATGCDIIAIDGTFREREGMTGPEFIARMRRLYPDSVFLADIATYEEAAACEQAGAHCVSTTLSGYTPDTRTDSPVADFALIEKASGCLSVPVFAEGRINTPEDAARAVSLGAYAVITGTAITRPRVVTQWFVKAIKNKNKYEGNKD